MAGGCRPTGAQKGHQRVSAVGGKDYPEPGDVAVLECDAIKTVSNVDLVQQDGPIAGVGPHDLGENALSRFAKLHGLGWRQVSRFVVHARIREIYNKPWAAVALWNKAERRQAQVGPEALRAEFQQLGANQFRFILGRAMGPSLRCETETFRVPWAGVQRDACRALYGTTFTFSEISAVPRLPATNRSQEPTHFILAAICEDAYLRNVSSV